MREKVIKLIIKLPLIFFVFVFIPIIFFDLCFFVEPQWNYFFSTLIAILITLLYFAGFIFYRKEYIIYKFSNLPKSRILNYIIFQFKVILLEDILLRYIPLIVATIFFDNHFLVCLILTIVFTILHFYKYPVISILVFIEFFLFFFISAIFFIEYKSFLILFLPHFLRNVILEFTRGQK